MGEGPGRRGGALTATARPADASNREGTAPRHLRDARALWARRYRAGLVRRAIWLSFRSVQEERLDVGVPARLYDPGGAKGLLLIGHGGGRSKDTERVVDLCRRYAAGTGLATLCIDAVDHGERRRPGVFDGCDRDGFVDLVDSIRLKSQSGQGHCERYPALRP